MSTVDEAPRRTELLGTRPTASGLRLATDKVLFGLLPPALFVTLLVLVVKGGYGYHFGFDFEPLWAAARDVLTGASPYPPPYEWALRDEQQFVYPPLAALLVAPLAFLPFPVATTLFAIALVATTALTLRVLGVRDWRCYGLALGWLPVIEAVALGTVTIPLALGLALAWRYRDHPWIAPLAVAAVVAAKVFLWPLLIWLVATRRGLSASKAAGLTAGGVLLSWAVIGFAGFTSYPRLLDALARLLEWKSYSAVALGLASGLTRGEARAVSFAIGALVLVVVVLRGRARDGDADRHAFVLAIGAAFMLTPIVWMHYLALLLVPIAIGRPRLTPLWLLPLAMWATPGQSDGHLWQIATGLSVWTLVLAFSLGLPGRRVAGLVRRVAV
jgi:alpha-1,2-mannosyltransferase